MTRLRRPSGWVIVAALALQLLASGCGAGARSDDSDLLVKDSFESAPGTGWLEESAAEYTLGYIDGRYQIRELTQGFQPHSHIDLFDPVQAMQVDVKARVEAGSPPYGFGIGCWSGVEDGYFAGIGSNGRYNIFRNPNATKYQGLAEGAAPASVIRDMENDNELRVQCTGAGSNLAKITLWVNGIKVGTAQDPDPVASFDGVGLFAASRDGDVDVRFDDFVARKISAPDG